MIAIKIEYCSFWTIEPCGTRELYFFLGDFQNDDNIPHDGFSIYNSQGHVRSVASPVIENYSTHLFFSFDIYRIFLMKRAVDLLDNYEAAKENQRDGYCLVKRGRDVGNHLKGVLAER